MHISIEFRFNHDQKASAVTGVEGDVTDVLLPNVGDLVRHSDSGHPFVGRVTERTFNYEIAEGTNIDGKVTVTLSLDRLAVN